MALVENEFTIFPRYESAAGKFVDRHLIAITYGTYNGNMEIYL